MQAGLWLRRPQRHERCVYGRTWLGDLQCVYAPPSCLMVTCLTTCSRSQGSAPLDLRAGVVDVKLCAGLIASSLGRLSP